VRKDLFSVLVQAPLLHSLQDTPMLMCLVPCHSHRRQGCDCVSFADREVKDGTRQGSGGLKEESHLLGYGAALCSHTNDMCTQQCSHAN
jgi:hypothetical protein